MATNLSHNSSQQPQAWTCAKCGAALPVEAAAGVSVTCSSCGTPFKLPGTQAQGGGVTISGGSVFVGGDVVGGSVVKVAPTAQKLGWWEKVKRLFSK